MSGSSIIEQAIYTSARSARGAGYHLTSASPGVSEADKKELPTWCPSHEGLQTDIPEQRSVNFFTLSSGTLCVSRTVQDGEDYSQRGAAKLLTNILLVPREGMVRFNMDPFAVLRAVELSGRMASTEESKTPHLAPIPLVGRASAVNEKLLTQLLGEIGPAKIGMAIDALLSGCPLAIGGAVSTERLLMAVWQCLPVACRDHFSFSSGLHYAPRRPFDIVALPADQTARRRFVRRYQLSTIDLESLDSAQVSSGGWASHVATTLAQYGAAGFAEQLASATSDLTVEDLPNLAAKLAQAHKFTAGSIGDQGSRARDPQMKVAHAHAPHRRHQQTSVASEPSICSLSLDVPNTMLEKLESLDDLIFDAIACRPGAIAQLGVQWSVVREELPPELLEESREHYLQHAMLSWEHFVAEGHSPERAVAALDVLAVICEQYAG